MKKVHFKTVFIYCNTSFENVWLYDNSDSFYMLNIVYCLLILLTTILGQLQDAHTIWWLEKRKKGLEWKLFPWTGTNLGKYVCFLWPAGPNAISVSLSPMGRYVMVGLASRRILLHPSTEHMVAQVFRLQQAHGGETSMRVSDMAVPPLEAALIQLTKYWVLGIISKAGLGSQGVRRTSSLSVPSSC